MSLPDNSDRLFFGLEAEVPEGWWVTETDYPELTLEKSEDAKIITTGGWGVEYPLTSVKKNRTLSYHLLLLAVCAGP